MQIKVRKLSRCCELEYSCYNTTIESGLLDEEEALVEARELIYAAELILEQYNYHECEKMLEQAREKIDEN